MDVSFNSLNSSFNDKKSINNKRLSKVFLVDVEDNDDSKEKKIHSRRKSAMLEMGLPRNITTTEISTHYGDCMKLASENKITSKNAFDLHLIDYLQGYMSSLQSLQVLSSSLDAGAKIYAGRVDLVHTNTYGILGGCGGMAEPGNQSVEAIETPSNDNEGDSDMEQQRVVKTKKAVKKRAEGHKKLTCDNMRKIRLTATQVRSEVDPLFQSQAQKYDEGGSGDLRSNHVRLLEDRYQLLLDFDTIVSLRCGDLEESELSEQQLDLGGEIADIVTDIARGPVDICEEFARFRFMGWDKDDEIDAPYRTILCSETVVENRCYDDYGDVDPQEDYFFEAGTEIDDVTIVPQGDMSDHVVSSTDGTVFGNGCSQFLSSMREMVSAQVDNNGTMVELEDALGMWAGPEHWRRRAKPVPRTQVPETTETTETKAPKKPKTKKAVVPMFVEWAETRLDDDGIGRLVVPERHEAAVRGGKVCTQLTDECIDKNMKREHLLPMRARFQLASLHQLMNREVSLVSRASKAQMEHVTEANIDDDQLPSLERGPVDSGVETGEEEVLVIDDNGDIPTGDHDYFSDDEPYMGTSMRECNFGDYGAGDCGYGDAVAAMGGECPEKIGINYSRTAKRVNVKRIKEEMVSYLREAIHIETGALLRGEDMREVGDACSLAEVLSAVDQRVSAEASKELSVSIMLTCLLHLANEAGLDVANTADHTDFALGQGHSLYDLEQIADFGLSDRSHGRGGTRPAQLTASGDESD